MRILHFADLHLGVESYGRIDPATGLSSRLGDFLAALDKLVDFAINGDVDLVLFCGDTYKTREPTQTQQREFARRINRLSTSNIPVFLLIGNHDLPNAISRATTTEIFDTLSIKNVYVSNRPDIYRIPTRHGLIQIASLPWLRRAALLATETRKNMTLAEIKEEMQRALAAMVLKHAEKIDPALPAVLAAHVWASGARVGSEKSMSLGEEPVLLAGTIADPRFDYVALGHIHKHQVLHRSPPVVYSGSLERVDFTEENDDKGFCVVDITVDGGKKQTSWSFQPVTGRRFLTIDVTLESGDLAPVNTVLRAIAEHQDAVRDGIVRMNIALPAELAPLVRDADIRDALKDAHFFSITRDVKRDARVRLAGWAQGEVTPSQALQAWVEQNRFPPEKARVLLEYGEKLINEKDRLPGQ